MSASIINELGTIEISDEVIRIIASEASMKSYGVTGLAYRNMTDGLMVFLKQDNLSKGVKVIVENNKINLELTLLLEYGVRIPLVAENIMEQVAYDIRQKVGMRVNNISILVQNMSLPNKE